MASTGIRVTLPPYLRERIQALRDVELPLELQKELAAAVVVAVDSDSNSSSDPPNSNSDPLEPEATIDEDLLTRLARWADTVEGRVALKRAGLDPGDYGLIALFAGTRVYLPPKQVELLHDKPNSFLPSYLALKPQTFGQEYRETARQLSTTINILFSIIGSAAAVYVASVTGAGYSRETAVVLAILAGVVVGLADMVLVWIVSDRASKGRAEQEQKRLESSKGSAVEAGMEVDMETGTEGQSAMKPKAGEVRLRRRALPTRDNAS